LLRGFGEVFLHLIFSAHCGLVRAHLLLGFCRMPALSSKEAESPSWTLLVFCEALTATVTLRFTDVLSPISTALAVGQPRAGRLPAESHPLQQLRFSHNTGCFCNRAIKLLSVAAAIVP
jgi:hypothetical protein